MINHFRTQQRFPYCLREWLNPKHYYRAIKWYGQRAFRGWADYDAWGLCHYLANDVIPGAVRHIIKNNNGTPIAVFTEKADRPEISSQALDRANKKWLKILNQIADGMEKFENIDCKSDDPKAILANYKKNEKEFEQALKLFCKYFSCLWD